MKSYYFLKQLLFQYNACTNNTNQQRVTILQQGSKYKKSFELYKILKVVLALSYNIL